MAEEIVSELGFEVADAIAALQQMDKALATTQQAFKNFGSTLASGFNGPASSATEFLRTLASEAGKTATALGAVKMPQQTGQLWLPPGTVEDLTKAKAAINDISKPRTPAKVVDPDTIEKAAKHLDSFNVSLNTLNRVVMTQFIVRIMSQVRDALKEATTASMDFQQAIAQIQTIAPRVGENLAQGVLGAASSFRALTDEVAAFSREYNVPLEQTSRGLYQIMSDQFTSVSDRANIMRASMVLSKTAVVDFEQASTLLTGALNAYGMSTSEAMLLSTKFFETIRLGHIEGSELAAVWGQLAPIGQELGVTIDEINAALVTMTIGGMDAHKSATALRGVMTAFIKPSEDMKKAMKEMGFSDPSQLIAARGFQGAMQGIADAAGNMGGEIAKSFRNVRALTGELRLTSAEGAKKYEEALQAMARSTPEMLQKIYDEFRSTDAERFQKEMNALKVNLTQDFGAALVKVLGDITSFVGGANEMSSALNGLAVAAGVMSAAFAISAASALSLKLALTPVGGVALAAGAAIAVAAGAATWAHSRNIAMLRAEDAESQRAIRARIEQIEELNRRQLAALDKQQKDIKAAYENAAASVRKTYYKAMEEAEAKNRTLGATAKATMDAMIAAQERVVTAYRNSANESVRLVRESVQQRISLEAEYSDAVFRYGQKNADADKQADAYRVRAVNLSKESASALSRAKTPDEAARARADAERAASFLAESAALAKQSGDLDRIDAAERTRFVLIQQRIEAEQQYQLVQSAEAQRTSGIAAEEQTRLNTMKAAATAISRDLRAFERGEVKDPLQLEKQRQNLKTNLDILFTAFEQGKGRFDISEMLGMSKLEQRVTLALQGGLSKAEIDELRATPDALAALQAQVSGQQYPIELAVKAVTGMDPSTKKLFEGQSTDEKQNTLQRMQEEGATAQKKRVAVEQDLAQKDIDLAARRTEMARVLSRVADTGISSTAASEEVEWWKRLAAQSRPEAKGTLFSSLRRTAMGALGEDWSPTSLQEALDWYTDVISIEDQVKRLMDPAAKPDAASLDRLKSAIAHYKETYSPSVEQSNRWDEVEKQAEGYLLLIKERQTMQQGMDANAAELQMQIQRGQDAERGMKKAQEAMKSMQSDVPAATQALQTLSNVDLTQGALYKSANSLAASIAQVVAAAQQGMQSGEAVPQWAGGHFASGALGTDVVPAWLSRGESVINAAASRKFASQIVAMNAGVQPVYRAQGGAVTNVGDVSIVVQESKSPRATARELMREFQREIRRGTGKL